MFCPKCGTQNAEGTAFCTNCGASLQNVGSSAPVQQQQGNYTGTVYQPMVGTQVMAPKKPNYTLIGILAIAAIAVIVVIVIVFSMKGGGGSVVGTWEVDPEMGYDMTITFNKDGTLVMKSEDFEQEAEYKIKGDTMTIIAEDGSEESGEFKVIKEKGKTVLVMLTDGEETSRMYKK